MTARVIDPKPWADEIYDGDRATVIDAGSEPGTLWQRVAEGDASEARYSDVITRRQWQGLNNAHLAAHALHGPELAYFGNYKPAGIIRAGVRVR